MKEVFQATLKYALLTMVIVMLMVGGIIHPALSKPKDQLIELSYEIQRYGHPGIIPSPKVIDKYRALGKTPPIVMDWPSPPPKSPVVGTKKILVILIDFPDHAGTQSLAYFQSLLFSGTPGSLSQYYTEVSYGLLSLAGVIADHWYRSAHDEDWWGEDVGRRGIDSANGPIFNLAREAVVLADANINFKAYDTDGDNVLDPEELSLCIVHAGQGQEATGDEYDIWSHRWYILGEGYTWDGEPQEDTFVDGVRVSEHPDDYVGGYFMQAEDSPMGTFAHEFGHDLGLPDLYDTDYSSDGIGLWCLMAAGGWLGPGMDGSWPSHPCGWCKAQLGWVTPALITSPINDVPVRQIETYQSQSLYKFEISSEEYFLIENREQTGYDRYLPGAGILIWHVDDSKRTNRWDDGGILLHRWVDLEEAHGGFQHLDHRVDGNEGDANDPYYSSPTGFADNTDPSSKAYGRRYTGFAVTDISAAGATMTVDFSVP